MNLTAPVTAWTDALRDELIAGGLDPRREAARAILDAHHACQSGEAWALAWVASDEFEGWCGLLGIVPARLRREILTRYLAEAGAPREVAPDGTPLALLELYRECGESVALVAVRLGVSRPTATQRLRAAGVAIHGRGRRQEAA